MSEGAKAAVTVSEMARLVGLSRARFYQLQKAGVFPPPERDPGTGRPLYTEGLQRLCLEVRRRHCGVNGKPVIFYARRQPPTPATPKPRKRKARRMKEEQYADLIDALKALGLASVTAAQVGSAVRDLYPQGTSGADEAEVVRAVFLTLRRKDSGGKVER